MREDDLPNKSKNMFFPRVHEHGGQITLKSELYDETAAVALFSKDYPLTETEHL